jgi:hypothetical protein
MYVSKYTAPAEINERRKNSPRVFYRRVSCKKQC